MKVRIKETGEVLVNVKYIDTTLSTITIRYLDDSILREKRIKKFSDIEEVKDYEEHKPWWYIDITLVVKQGELFLSNLVEQFKTVGNYFETREEAEKAVEKLKAWKRLKDKGFINKRVFSMNLNWCNPDDDDWKAFELLFRGEND